MRTSVVHSMDRSMAATLPTRGTRLSDPIVCWDKLGEIANQYCTKGRLVYVAGRLQYRGYEGCDGQPKRAVEVIASDLGLLDRRPDAEPAEEPVPDEPPGA